MIIVMGGLILTYVIRHKTIGIYVQFMGNIINEDSMGLAR